MTPLRTDVHYNYTNLSLKLQQSPPLAIIFSDTDLTLSPVTSRHDPTNIALIQENHPILPPTPSEHGKSSRAVQARKRAPLRARATCWRVGMYSIHSMVAPHITYDRAHLTDDLRRRSATLPTTWNSSKHTANFQYMAKTAMHPKLSTKSSTF